MTRPATPLRLVFAGTPEFAATALESILLAGHQVVAVYTQPDRPAGRGRHLKPSAVKEVALRHALPIEQPATLKTVEAVATLAGYQPDVMIVAAYGLILPKAILTTPRLGCLNIHASLLPRWRGAAPIQRAILAGDRETGITIMQMDEGLDTGPMLLKQTCAIGPRVNAGLLHDQLASLGATAILAALQQLLDSPIATPQDSALATYASKLDKSEAWIDWSQSATQIDRQIRAFNPWPIAQTRLAEHIIRIWEAEPVDLAGPAGQILHAEKSGIVVGCGQSALQLLRCQLPGGKPLGVAEILNGHANLFSPGHHFTQ